jgi:uncharacterized protein
VTLGIADTGPLVAAFNRNDAVHDWARDQLGRLSPPLLVCEPVLTEAAFLLSRMLGSADDLFELLERGLLELAFSLDEHRVSVRKLMQRYRDVPMSLADACVVRMAELHPTRLVWTLDSDFSIYRRNGRQVIRLLSPRE